MSKQSSDDEQDQLAQVLTRYKSTKGDLDQRKETSKLNMAKVRAAKLAGLTKKKAEQPSKVHYIDESSDSDEEEIVIQRKPAKGKGRAGAAAASAPSESRMAELEAAFEAMNKQKKSTLIQQVGKGAPKYDILNM
jgi:hypothetical protein